MTRIACLMLAAVVVVAAGCTPDKGTYVLLGKDLVETDAASEDLALAETSVLSEAAHWIDEGEGRRSCPSMASHSRWWRIGPDQERDPDVARSTLSFDDPDGRHVVIERIRTHERTLVFITRDEGEALDIVNRFVAALEERGVVHRR